MTDCSKHRQFTGRSARSAERLRTGRVVIDVGGAAPDACRLIHSMESPTLADRDRSALHLHGRSTLGLAAPVATLADRDRSVLHEGRQGRRGKHLPLTADLPR